jgi:hypothetical protein
LDIKKAAEVEVQTKVVKQLALKRVAAAQHKLDCYSATQNRKWSCYFSRDSPSHCSGKRKAPQVLEVEAQRKVKQLAFNLQKKFRA